MTAPSGRLLHGGKLAIAVLALAVASLAAVVTAARPAHAGSGASISAYEGPQEVWVTGSGFTHWANVRLVVLTDPGLQQVGPVQYTQADGSGGIARLLTGLRPYSGSVYVAADQTPPIGTAWAVTQVDPAPVFTINGTGQQSCGYPVSATVAGLEEYYDVRIELLSADRTKLLDWRYTTSDSVGDAAASPQLSTSGYAGWAWIVADEYGGAYPAPATVGYYLYVC